MGVAPDACMRPGHPASLPTPSEVALGWGISSWRTAPATVFRTRFRVDCSEANNAAGPAKAGFCHTRM